MTCWWLQLPKKTSLIVAAVEARAKFDLAHSWLLDWTKKIDLIHYKCLWNIWKYLPILNYQWIIFCLFGFCFQFLNCNFFCRFAQIAQENEHGNNLITETNIGQLIERNDNLLVVNQPERENRTTVNSATRFIRTVWQTMRAVLAPNSNVSTDDVDGPLPTIRTVNNSTFYTGLSASAETFISHQHQGSNSSTTTNSSIDTVIENPNYRPNIWPTITSLINDPFIGNG